MYIIMHINMFLYMMDDFGHLKTVAIVFLWLNGCNIK